VLCLIKTNQPFHLDDDLTIELENLIGRAPEGSFPAITALLDQYRGDADARTGALAAWSASTDDRQKAKTAVSQGVVTLDERYLLPEGT
jgi:hypothetical protein